MKGEMMRSKRRAKYKPFDCHKAIKKKGCGAVEMPWPTDCVFQMQKAMFVWCGSQWKSHHHHHFDIFFSENGTCGVEVVIPTEVVSHVCLGVNVM